MAYTKAPHHKGTYHVRSRHRRGAHLTIPPGPRRRPPRDRLTGTRRKPQVTQGMRDIVCQPDVLSSLVDDQWPCALVVSRAGGQHMRVCPIPGCPHLTAGGRCPAHARAQDKARGTRQQRGYNAEHDRLRRKLAPLVARGQARCARCGEPISPTEPWDLGHTEDRTAWTGPEHANRCNRAAGGRAAHQ